MEICGRVLAVFEDGCDIFKMETRIPPLTPQISDQPRRGGPQTASTEKNKERVDELIKKDRRLTADDIARIME